MSVVICVIAKHEDPYIHEWIQYHLKLGVDHIYLYDNHFVSHYHPLATEYSKRVTVFHLPGHCMQMSAYYHFLHYARALPGDVRPTWVAFIDVDEFIVIRGDSASLIRALMATVRDDAGALGLNWVLFGNNDQETHDTGRGVLERFTRRQQGVNPHIKSIVRLDAVQQMISPHHAAFIDPATVARDCDGVPIAGPYHPLGNDRVACIHHYFTKSNEEFYQKCQRGRADISDYRTFEADFHRHNFNDLEDYSALDFWYKN